MNAGTADAVVTNINTAGAPPALQGKTLTITAVAVPAGRPRPQPTRIAIPAPPPARTATPAPPPPPQVVDLPAGTYQIDVPNTSDRDKGGLATIVTIRDGETLTIDVARRTVTVGGAPVNMAQPSPQGAPLAPTPVQPVGSIGRPAAPVGLPTFLATLGVGITSPGGGDRFFVDFDSLRVPEEDVTRLKGFGGTTGTFGLSGQYNIPYALPYGIQPMVRFGVNVNAGASHDQVIGSPPNSFPLPTTKVEQRTIWSFPLMIGAAVPVIDKLWLDASLGFYLNSETFKLRGTEANGGGEFSASKSRVAFDPAFGLGAMYRLSDFGGYPLFLGGGVTFIKRGDATISADSPCCAASQSYTAHFNQGWDTQIGLALSLGFGQPPPPPPPPP